MYENIQKRPKLLIVSDTAISYDNEGHLIAFEPVVREIEHFAPLFESISWIVSLHAEGAKNRRAINGVDVNIIPCKNIGGHGLKNKISIIVEYFHLFFLIRKEIKKADVIHSRGPSHAAIICAFLSFFIRKDKIYWHKYAGNWVQNHPPFSYGLLRFLLKRAYHTSVTINGRWPDQKPNQLTFENPCLTSEELKAGSDAVSKKDFSGRLNLAFVGRLEDAKGVHRLLHVLSEIDSDRVGSIHLIGDGPKRDEYEEFAKKCHQDIVFHGFLKREEIDHILTTAHIFVLPSDSEGFPKVVAEAANFGLVPIVSDVSCIGQYVIENETGFLVQPTDEYMLHEKIQHVLGLDVNSLKTMSLKCHAMAEQFTYEHYNKRIREEIIQVR